MPWHCWPRAAHPHRRRFLTLASAGQTGGQRPGGLTFASLKAWPGDGAPGAAMPVEREGPPARGGRAAEWRLLARPRCRQLCDHSSREEEARRPIIHFPFPWCRRSRGEGSSPASRSLDRAGGGESGACGQGALEGGPQPAPHPDGPQTPPTPGRAPARLWSISSSVSVFDRLVRCRVETPLLRVRFKPPAGRRDRH